jgi:hypothetical protein
MSYQEKKLNKKAFSRLILTLIISIFVLIVFFLIIFFFNLRSIYLGAVNSRQDLEKSIEFMLGGNFSQASEFSSRANEGFALTTESLNEIQDKFFVKNFNFLFNGVRDLKNLAQVAEILSYSLESSLSLIEDLEDVFSGRIAGDFYEFKTEERIRILKTLYESCPEMYGIKANIDLALFYLNQFDDNFFLSSYSNDLEPLKEELSFVSSSLDKITLFSSMIPFVAGYPEPVSYLLILQNSNELRPSGGFVGTYGILEIDSGDISSLETHDIYHLDMPASLNESFDVEAPEAIKKYLGVDKWFMRDANWSPDWPSSASNLEWFYEQEMIASDREDEIIDFSGVIAVNPQLVIDFLDLIGPVKVDDKTYNKDNFMENLQYETEVAFQEEGGSEWERKEVIGDILKEMKENIFDLDSNLWSDVIDILDSNIEKKNILLYLNDERSQKISSNLGWSGEVKDPFLDYLMIVDANMAAFKTDRVMNKEIRYYLNEEEDGRFKARLELDYRNDGWFDWQTTRYRSFTRLYVPYGSVLLPSSSGESSLDEEISNPKTYFSSFISIEPKDTETLVFEYYLPNSLSSSVDEYNFYSLDLQKQPGNNIALFEARFDFSRPIIKAEGEGVVNIDNNSLYWSNDLEKDYSLKVRF